MPSAPPSAQLQHPSRASTSQQSIYGASRKPAATPPSGRAHFHVPPTLASLHPPILAKTG
jgi:hypothetical protein